MTTFNESTVEEAALSWFEELGHAVSHGPNITPSKPEAKQPARRSE
jgi:type I restriction enzyme R subunit